jgi:hypothetical protein
MASAPYALSISAARANALFASPLPRSDQPTAGQVRQAIATALGVHGVRGCAARVAQAYGEQPNPRSPGCAGRSLRQPAPSVAHRQRQPTPPHPAAPP